MAFFDICLNIFSLSQQKKYEEISDVIKSLYDKDFHDQLALIVLNYNDFEIFKFCIIKSGEFARILGIIFIGNGEFVSVRYLKIPQKNDIK